MSDIKDTAAPNDRVGLINGVRLLGADYQINYEYLANKPNLENKVDKSDLDVKADRSDIVQSDWSVSDETSNAFIKNKPNLDDKADKTDIVQSDWDETDSSSSSFIKNKPDISSIVDKSALDAKADKSDLDEKADKSDIVQSDWSETNNTSNAFIKNKPNIDELRDRVDSIEGQKGAVGGIATLDSNGKVPESQLPAMGGHYAGTSAPSNTNLLWINTSNNTINYYTGSGWKAIGSVFG